MDNDNKTATFLEWLTEILSWGNRDLSDTDLSLVDATVSWDTLREAPWANLDDIE